MHVLQHISRRVAWEQQLTEWAQQAVACAVMHGVQEGLPPKARHGCSWRLADGMPWGRGRHLVHGLMLLRTQAPLIWPNPGCTVSCLHQDLSL